MTKLNEELFDYKLTNSKLKNEILILGEEIKTMKQIVLMKNNENELIQAKCNDFVDEYKKETEKMKKLNREYMHVKELINKQNTYVKSTIGELVDIIEVCLFMKPS